MHMPCVPFGVRTPGGLPWGNKRGVKGQVGAEGQEVETSSYRRREPRDVARGKGNRISNVIVSLKVAERVDLRRSCGKRTIFCHVW